MFSLLWTLFTVSSGFVIQSSPGSQVDTGVPSNCTVFAVTQSGDTCNGIEWYFNITQNQFTSWNPSLQSDCSGLSVNNYSYCAQIAQPPSTEDYTYTLPDQTPTGTEGVYSPVQTGIASNCESYYYVGKNDTCQEIVDYYGGLFSLQDFYTWNPAVGDNCNNLFAGYFVCIGTASSPTQIPVTGGAASTATGPSPEQTGIPSNCTNYYLVQSGDGCYDIAAKNGIKLADFYSWNPAVGSDCSHLYLGYYVCVGVPNYAYATTASTTSSPITTSSTASSTATGGVTAPSPTQSGIASNCNQYYKAVSGDSCYAIASKNNTYTVAQFEGWNPAVGSDCSSLWVGYWYCTGVSGGK